jgi:hypothetical protein
MRKGVNKIIILSFMMVFCFFSIVNAAIIFEDDFSDGVADGWNEFMGSFEVINEEYVAIEGEDRWSLTGDFTWANYIYEARVKMDIIDNDFGLIFYAQNINEYLRFTIGGEEGTNDPRISGNGAEFANVVNYPELIDGKWYDIKLVIQGNMVSAYVDCELIAYAENLPYNQGAIGLASDSEWAIARFDDIIVKLDDLGNGCDETVEVEINIKPGSYHNSINPRSKGVIPVAIITTDDFDATMVDPSTVMFGPGGASMIHRKAHVEDVDEDGDLDLVFHFYTQETGFACGDIETILTGQTWDGIPIEGAGEVDLLGCD